MIVIGMRITVSVKFHSVTCALKVLVGGRKGVRPVKKLSGGVLAWLLSIARCRFAFCRANVTATHSVAPINPDWFYFSGTGSPR